MNDEQTPALRQAVENMANMREAYDNLSQAAEAYNTGKTELAANINTKGVEASATETLPELAQKVAAISQETYEIDGGEMYAKQLFGSLETPNYWNLYEVLAQLLSDGRLVSYGGILLAEYYRGYDSLALAGAGAGGAYVVSDKDENGQFMMYTEDTTHTWATEFDGHGNRWVAYCFADEYHDFQITDTNTSPRSIFIGRKVGTITNLVNTRVSQIVVPDGSELNSFSPGSYTNQFQKMFVLRNVNDVNEVLFKESTVGLVESAYLQVNGSVGGNGVNGIFYISNSIRSIIIEANRVVAMVAAAYYSKVFLLIKAEFFSGGVLRMSEAPSAGSQYSFILEEGSFSIATCQSNIYIGFIRNDKTKSVVITETGSSKNYAGTIVELQNEWCKNLQISSYVGLTEANIYTYILQKLKQDEPDCGDGVTITLGQTNLDKLTSEESVALLDELTNTFGYTFA